MDYELWQELGLTFADLWQATGIEVEEHRVQKSGCLSRHEYPNIFGSRNFHPMLQSDFGESQMELVTLPQPNLTAAMSFLDVLQAVVQRQLNADEVIWPLSLPPHLSDDDKQFVTTHFGRPKYQQYRDYLLKNYGIEQELITGIHVNISLNEVLLEKLFKQAKLPNSHFVSYKNHTYFHVAQFLSLHRYLLTYFFGASPISENQYWRIPEHIHYPVRSLRSSTYGFENTADKRIGYISLHDQINAIEHQIAKRRYFSEHEFYGPVRVKSKGDFRAVFKNGIDYLELRMFDLNPFEPNHLSLDALNFVRLLIAQSLFTAAPKDMNQAYAAAMALNEKVALTDPSKKIPQFIAWAQRDFKLLYQTCERLGLPDYFKHLLDRLSKQLDDPQDTLGYQVAAQIQNNSLENFGLTQGQKFKMYYAGANAKTWPFLFLKDTLNLSQQLVLQQAIIHGFKVNWQVHRVMVQFGKEFHLYDGDWIRTPQAADQWLQTKFRTLRPDPDQARTFGGIK
ncbi:gamma-glutamylcysteine synthetase [Lactobacillus sp. CC-MHH1034]|uniref:gamma-glutamylcysteine synthetase n=1 Tax=Agrilactobacillus fermenti TaxID=2586909 RepID=UPI001E60C840|nr:gamma-glutamylcysteine synthetase [Agrilactobacillus fermenti]MCD2255530.1 gamma-glutamylcysteine synthetase [Agrilactobacillus fermenti]